jgi:polysaccharide pyruvyl transferase WcaK-like protein
MERLRHFSLVAVRDSRSAAEVRCLGGECRVLPDLSLYLPWPATDYERREMAVTDSVDRETTLRLDAVRRAMGADWLPIQARGSGVLEAIAFVRYGIARSDVRDLRMAWAMARARISMSHARRASPDMFLDDLSRLQLLVSGRFHACALAMLTGTPFVSVPSNTGKIQALLHDAGLSQWRCKPDLSPLGLRDAWRTGWELGEQAALMEYIAAGRAATDLLFRDIRSLA